MDLLKRENQIFDILQKFNDKELEFVVVGGYAVSAFKHRFSVDADVVIKDSSLERFKTLLEKEGFKEAFGKELTGIYSPEFKRYEKDKVFVDLMVNALVSRTTDAAWSFDLLHKNSVKRKIIGIEKEVTASVPIKELLIAFKIHSGRLTDFRDVAALAKDIDLEKVSAFLFRGDIKAININLKKLNTTVHDKNFVDSFKGVFLEKKFDIDFSQVEKISKMKVPEGLRRA
ncbi:MAG TPA: nucleotidyltransferase family protein [Nanoarchaeota archaeon]|nr:nucleotidyltransferase family protein [Nanoarchaeota archaeon]